MARKRNKRIKAEYCPPVNIPLIIESRRLLLEEKLGKTWRLLNVDNLYRQIFYRKGSTVVVNCKKYDGYPFSLTIYPKNLSFDPKTILRFLKLTGNTEGELKWASGGLLVLHGDPRFSRFYAVPIAGYFYNVDFIRMFIDKKFSAKDQRQLKSLNADDMKGRGL